MRSLKKALTLALVFVMAIGLLSVSALDFTDADDIQYSVAVEVMTNLGAINGYPDGTFGPDGLVTRAEAAKLVTYAILSPRVAEYLPSGSSSFNDVPGNHWAAPYIEYCVSQGIVAGRGNGVFDPNGNVTAFELGKMLLTAAGYGKNNEYVGASWSLNVVTDAIDNNLFAGTKATNYGAPATREEAALYVFNGLNVDRVEYSKDTESYKKLTADKTIGVQKYGLAKNEDPVNGVQGYVWESFGKAVSGFVMSENVLGTNTKGTKVSALSNRRDRDFVAELSDDVEYFYNGDEVPAYAAGAYEEGDMFVYNKTLYVVVADVDLTEDDAIATELAETEDIKLAEYSVKGSIVSLISTNPDAKAEKVSIVEKTVARVAANVYINPITEAITIAGVGDTVFEKDKVVYPEDLALNDWVLFYKDNADVTRIEKAAVVKGEMTSANTTYGTITFAGASYAASGLVNGTVVTDFYGNSRNYNVAATAYLDNNGDIVQIAADVATGPATTYGLLVGYEFTPGTAGYFGTPASAKALLYTADGKVAPYSVAADATSKVVENQTADFPDNANLVSYRINSNGEVTLTAVGAEDALSADYVARTATMTLGAKGNVYITSDTKVIYFDSTKVYNPDPADSNLAKFVTGFVSTSAADEDTVVTYVLKGDSNVADVVFVSDAPGVVELPGQYAYVHAIIRGENVRYVDGVAYSDYTIFMNGVATSLTSKTSGLFNDSGLYKYTVDSNGYVLTATAEEAIVGGKVTYVDAGFVGYLNNDVNESAPVTASTKYYMVSQAGVVEAPIAASTAHVDYVIQGIEKDTNGVATAIYFGIVYN